MYCFVVILVTCLTGTTCLDAILGTVPTKIFGKWTGAHLDRIICPSGIRNFTNEGFVNHSLTIELQWDHPELKPVTGHICHGLKYTTKCTEGFFGTQDIEKHATRIEVKFSECLKSIKKYSEGSYINPFFPAPNCNWMATNEVSEEFVIVDAHSVRVDPYTMDFVDAIFPGGKCEGIKCPTLHENTIWIGDYSRELFCGGWSTQESTVFVDANEQVKYLLHSVNTVESMHDVCKMTYCGKPGIRLATGLFIATTKKLSVPRCEIHTSVAVFPANAEIEELAISVKDLSTRLDCLNSLQTVRATRQVDFLTLGKLNPLTPGRHPIYRLNNNTLEMNYAYWSAVQNFTPGQGNLVGHLLNGKPFSWGSWIPSGIPGMLSGYNGVHKGKDQITVIPLLDIMKQKYAESVMIQHSLINVTHPEIKYLEREGLDGDIITLHKTHQVDFAGWVSGMWNSIWGKVGLFVMALVIFGIPLCVLRCFLKRKCTKNTGNEGKESSRSPESIPMKPLKHRTHHESEDW